ncbi:MAG TPA: hypothetical protein DIU14_01085 [Actinobacteria bacterium]|nr:hypothetical protein [Actinomycetota bacterium]
MPGTDARQSTPVEHGYASNVQHVAILVSPDHDGTLLYKLSKLTPATTYYYKFADKGTGQQSRTGRFTTAPAADSNVGVTFTFSGDQDGTPNTTTPSLTCPGEAGFKSFTSAMNEAGNQFYVNLGDTIYSDSSCLTTPDSSLTDYRNNYQQNLSYPSLRDFRAAAPFYTQWDDHEVQNDFDPTTVDPTLLANGRQAFQEYDAMRPPSSTLGFYRHFRYGANAEVFILDERSFRTNEADRIDANANGTEDCQNATTGQPDVAPTLNQSTRNFFAAQIPGLGLDQPVPRLCLKNLNAKGRTMLGSAQRHQFLSDLAASTATWKIVMSEDPMQQFFAFPYDRWEGFRWERNTILHNIDDNNINNVVWLATDVHAFMAHTVDYNTDTAGSPSVVPACAGVQGMCEYTVGPVATDTFAKEINDLSGSSTASGKVRGFLVVVNKDLCAGINNYGYGKVNIDGATHQLSVYPKFENGTAVAGNGGSGSGYSDCYDLHQNPAP